jgi:hypothetical protein
MNHQPSTTEAVSLAAPRHRFPARRDVAAALLSLAAVAVGLASPVEALPTGERWYSSCRTGVPPVYYPHGEEIVVAGYTYRCNDGRWEQVGRPAPTRLSPAGFGSSPSAFGVGTSPSGAW